MSRNASDRTACAAPRRRAFVFALVCLFALVAGGSREAVAAEPGSLAVAPGRISPALAPISAGFTHWVRTQMEGAGVEVRTLPAPAGTPQSAAPESSTIAAAKAANADHVLFIDLTHQAGAIEVLFRLIGAADGALAFSARNAAASGMLHVAAGQSVTEALMRLGVPPERTGVTSTFEIGDLAELGQVVKALDAGQLVAAWRALQGLPAGLAEPLRVRIGISEANANRTSTLRLMVLRGEAEAAWKEILREASEHLYGEAPDADILLTAGEIQFARGKLHEAQAYFERALEVRSDDFDAALGLASVLGDQQNEAGSDAAFARAEALRPGSLRLRMANADAPSEDPAKGARAALVAARALVGVFDRARANPYFARAIALDGTTEGDALRDRAALELELGDTTAALASYRKATEVAPTDPAAWRGLARTLHRLADTAGARRAYVAALEIEPNDPVSRLALARFQIAEGEPQLARPQLETLVSEATPSAEAMQLLARLQRDAGELDAALALALRAEKSAGQDATSLRLRASIEEAKQEPAASAKSLERAARLEPSAPDLRERLAALYTKLGRTAEAAKQRALLERLAGPDPKAVEHSQVADARSASRERGPFDGLITSFGVPRAGARRAVLVDVSKDAGIGDWLLAWWMPRRIEMDRLEAGLRAAIAVHYDVIDPEAAPTETDRIEAALLAAETSGSIVIEQRRADLDALGTDVAFAARISHGSPLTPPRCAAASQLHVEMFRLGGDPTMAAQVQSLCLPDGVASFSTWNESAAVLGFIVLFILALPLLRGRGEVEVRVALPEGSRPRLKLTLSATGMRARTLPVEGDEPIRFTRIPARRSLYMVRLTGSLDHAETGQRLIEISTEKPVQVRRGDSIALDFDLVRHASIVEVSVQEGPFQVTTAYVALRNQPASVRALADGITHFHLEPGQHGFVVGANDRVVRFEADVRQGRVVELDLARPTEVIIQGCTNAVLPYLEGDMGRTLDALDEAGMSEAADVIRSQMHTHRGDPAEAHGSRGRTRTLNGIGEDRSLADVVHHDDVQLAQAGSFDEAGDAKRDAGQLLEAASAYEANGDYESAADCYRQLGDAKNAIAALEKANDHFQAARLSLGLKDTERALHNFSQVGPEDARHAEACWSIGIILADRGDAPYALERFEAAHASGGLPAFPAAALDRYSRLLESSQRYADARAALLELRRLDPARADIAQRIEAAETAMRRMGGDAAPDPAPARTPTQKPANAPAPAATAKNTSASGPAAAPAPGATRPSAPPTARKAQAPSPAPDTRYSVHEKLGEGALGEVVKATDTQRGETVALRFVCDAIAKHPIARDQLIADAQAARMLAQPNILPTLDAGRREGRIFLACAYLDGSSLDKVLERRGRLPTKVVAQLGVQAATALHFAHRNGVLHLDIRPSQLFLTRDKVVKLIGFGLGGAIDILHRDGTPLRDRADWRAPERMGGSVDARTDLFDLGVTLFQLVTGTRPQKKAGGGVAKPLDPRTEMHDIEMSLASLIACLTDPDPEARPSLAKDVVRALQSVITEVNTPG